ncbi:MAG: hypothetical protein HQ511_12290 [Rhodospirillales bacterium]|nr:hypothetical protein [Rhodospirillales bacterium]
MNTDYETANGARGTRWFRKGYFTSLEHAFVHSGRHFLEQIDGEFGTDALPALFDLVDEFKRLGQETVDRLPAIPD